MKPKAKETREQRLARIQASRAEIITHIVALEKQYGQSAVSGAFARHTQVRREREYLLRTKREVNAKIAKLQGRGA